MAYLRRSACCQPWRSSSSSVAVKRKESLKRHFAKAQEDTLKNLIDLSVLLFLFRILRILHLFMLFAENVEKWHGRITLPCHFRAIIGDYQQVSHYIDYHFHAAYTFAKCSHCRYHFVSFIYAPLCALQTLHRQTLCILRTTPQH